MGDSRWELSQSPLDFLIDIIGKSRRQIDVVTRDDDRSLHCHMERLVSGDGSGGE